jgi:hypothetical protein
LAASTAKWLQSHGVKFAWLLWLSCTAVLQGLDSRLLLAAAPLFFNKQSTAAPSHEFTLLYWSMLLLLTADACNSSTACLQLCCFKNVSFACCVAQQAVCTLFGLQYCLLLLGLKAAHTEAQSPAPPEG